MIGRYLFSNKLSFLILLFMLYSCAPLKTIDDFFGIQMNPLDEKDFQIFSYSEIEGVKYQSNNNMHIDINAWAEIGVEEITFKIVNNSPRPVPLDYFTDQFVIITDENQYKLNKGPRADYFFGDKISPGSSAEISLKIPSEFSQDFIKREGAILNKDIMGDFSKNWSQSAVFKENIKYIIIRLSAIEIVLKKVPE